MSVEAPDRVRGVTDRTSAPSGDHDSHLSAEAFLSLGCMEGILDPIVTESVLSESATPAVSHKPGYILAMGIAALAYLLHYAPFAPFTVAGAGAAGHPISSAIIAILIGLAIRNVLPLPDSITKGCKSAVKKVIPLAIVCIGAGLNFSEIAGVGVRVLVIALLGIGIGISLAYGFGRLLGLRKKTAFLLGAGTGICGNSAIVAVAPLIDAEDDDIVLSIGAVNLLGLLAMLTWPIFGTWMNLRQDVFGVWSGTSIHAVPQVIAAGFAYGTEAGTMATLVKLVRVAFLAPLVLILALFHAKHKASDHGRGSSLTIHYARLVPWFVWGFLAFAIINTIGLIPTLQFELSEYLAGNARHVSVAVGDVFQVAGKILLTIAMAAIGLEVNIRQIGGVGAKVIIAGVLSTVALGAVSLALIHFLM